MATPRPTARSRTATSACSSPAGCPASPAGCPASSPGPRRLRSGRVLDAELVAAVGIADGVPGRAGLVRTEGECDRPRIARQRQVLRDVLLDHALAGQVVPDLIAARRQELALFR